MLFSRAYRAAAIFPSIPRLPNPPGTRTPLTPLRYFSAPCFSMSSASTRLMSTAQSLAAPACFNASYRLL